MKGVKISATIDVHGPAKRVLMVLSNPSTSEQTGWPIGFWWAELTHPYWEFTEAGYEVTIASPDGGALRRQSHHRPAAVLRHRGCPARHRHARSMSMTAGNQLSVVIVGAGSVGSALATNLRALGHEVRFALRSPRDEGDVGLDRAAVGADVTILAVPFDAIDTVVPRLGLEPGDVLIDATNPFGRPLPDGVPDGAALVARAAGEGVRVVKAFNVLGAEHMTAPPLPDGRRPLLSVAADDDAARTLVADLATDMGFDAVPISGIDNAGLLEDAARYWGLLAFNGGRGRDVVLIAHQRHPAAAP